MKTYAGPAKILQIPILSNDKSILLFKKHVQISKAQPIRFYEFLPWFAL